MKRSIHKLIDYFAYRNPQVWHELTDDFFFWFKEKQKKDMAKTKIVVNKLYNKLMKK